MTSDAQEFKSTSEHGFDYSSIKLKVGLEVHQQLATRTKLFCDCAPFSGETSEGNQENAVQFKRILRPVSSELGEVDEAARFESRRQIIVRYSAPSQFSCLVEADEEPPHPISEEGVDTSLIFALALHSKIIEEIHVMRKIVVDGSNTSGFQRTAVVALGGKLSYAGGKFVAVQTVSLEEDAARALGQEPGESTGSERHYSLDRLGTPLVEVALAPIEGTPEEVELAAKTLGRLLRSTGRVARGLGTIRQDLNVSVLDGRVVEVKGVQRLDQIKKIVIFEAARQKFFKDLGDEIKSRIGDNKVSARIEVVTDVFAHSASNVLRKALSSDNSAVYCIIVSKFKGFLGKENAFNSRLGKELGSIAKSYGLGGVFHSDELPNYGITQDEISSLRENFAMENDDAFVLIAGPSEKVSAASDALKRRIEFSVFGIPAETRSANLEGETQFLRPRPGAARMYPETDIPLIRVSEARIEKLREEIPEPWEKQVLTFSRKFDLPLQLAEPLYESERRELFETVVRKTGLPPRFVASILVDTMLALSRDEVKVELLSYETLLQAFEALAAGTFAKEALPKLLRELAKDPKVSVNDAISRAGLRSISREELERVVDEVIMQNRDMIRTRGVSGSQSIVMGKVMQVVRGKFDGKTVSETVSVKLSQEFEKGKS